MANFDGKYAAPQGVLLQTSQNRFDFGKFRHRPIIYTPQLAGK